MEDPWVTPWTADSPAKLDLPAPPPHAHFSSDHRQSSGSIQQDPQRRSPARSPARSPWDEDDAWGGWNEPGRDSPGWGRSPGLKPSEGSTSRLPSPDPWGKLAVLESAHIGIERLGNGSQEKIVDSAISLSDKTRRDSSADRGRGRVQSIQIENVKEITEEDVWAAPDPNPEPIIINLPKPMIAPDVTLPESPRDHADSVYSSQSRPSTGRQSSKVQGLVDMYDGMAKRATSLTDLSATLPAQASEAKSTEEPLAAAAESTSATETPQLNEKDPGQAIIGEPQPPLADEEIEVPALSEKPAAPIDEQDEHITSEPTTEQKSISSEIETSPETQEQKGERLPDKISIRPEPESKSDPLSEETPQPSTKPRNPPSIQYNVDLSGLDDLFPSVSASYPSPEPIPDIIIDDTFTTISERKTWYRISRLGSIRKHDLGNDENYVRIGWGRSKIREQSIQTVRRWMEEDSIGGRLVLGRRMGAAGGKIFNWDSSTPTVGIGELFARRSQSRRASSNSRGTVATPTATTFGWNNSPVPSPTIAVAPAMSETSVNVEPASANRSPASLHSPFPPPSRPLSISSRPGSVASRPVSMNQIIAPPISPLGQPPETAGPDDDDEDDDEDDEDNEWGEMVSSPTAQTNGTFPSIPPIVDSNTDIQVPKEVSPTSSASSAQSEDEEDWGEMMSSPTIESNNTFPTMTTLLTNTNHAEALSVSSPMLVSPWEKEVSAQVPKASVAISTPTTNSFRDSWGFKDLFMSPGTGQPTGLDEPAPRQSLDKRQEAPTQEQPRVPLLATSGQNDGVSLPLTNPAAGSPSTSTSDDYEIVAAEILGNLPDLGYMLR